MDETIVAGSLQSDYCEAKDRNVGRQSSYIGGDIRKKKRRRRNLNFQNGNSTYLYNLMIFHNLISIIIDIFNIPVIEFTILKLNSIMKIFTKIKKNMVI